MNAIEIDPDARIWAEVPTEFPRGPYADQREWGEALAAAYSTGRDDAVEVEAALRRGASVIPSEPRLGLLQRFWWVRDPFGPPLLLDVHLVPEEVVGDIELQDFLGAYGGDTVRPPIVDRLDTPNGEAVRVTSAILDEESQISTSTRYAVRAGGWVVVLTATSYEPARLELAGEDTDAVLERIRVGPPLAR